MRVPKHSIALINAIIVIALLSACGKSSNPTVQVTPTVLSARLVTTLSTQPASSVPTVGTPAETASPEPCAPSTGGVLAWVDPRGQTVVWWHQQSGVKGDALATLVSEFNTANECKITVDAEYQGSYNDIRDKMNAAIDTGALPGLAAGYPNDEAYYALSGSVVDIQPYLADTHWGLSAEEQADFYPVFLKQGVHPAFSDMRLGFPPNRSAEVIFYNLTWLKELGFTSAPSSPLEFKDMACAAATARGDGTGGFILRSDASAIAAWTYAYGGDILSQDGLGYDLHNQATIAAMTFLKGMLDDGCAYIQSEGYPDSAFSTRQAIFTEGSTSDLPDYQESIATAASEGNHPADEWGITAVPHTTSEPYTDIYGGDLLIPATNPQVQLAAWVFITWFTQPDVMARWDEASGYFPTRMSANQYMTEYLVKNTQYAQGLALLKYGRYEPQLISYQDVRNLITQAFYEIVQGADITSILSSLTEQANALQAELLASP